MSRRVKEDEIDVDEAEAEATADDDKAIEDLSSKAVMGIIFPEIGGKAIKAEFAELYESFVGMSDEEIVLAYREYYKSEMAKKAAPKEAKPVTFMGVTAPVAEAPKAEEATVTPVAEASSAPVFDEAALKEAYMASVNELLSHLPYAEDEKKDFVKSLNIETLTAEQTGALIESVVGKMAEYHTAKAEAAQKAAEAKAAQEAAIAVKPQRTEYCVANMGAPKASRGYYDKWENGVCTRHYDDGRPDAVINRIKAAKPVAKVEIAAKPQQYVAPAAKVATTPIIVKPESKPQKSFVSGGNKITINADGTVSVQAERKPVKPTQTVLMNLKGGTQLVLMSTYVNHGGRLASGTDYEIPNKGSVKVEAVDGGFNETVTWTDGGTKESFYPAVKAVGIKLSTNVIRMTKVPDGIADDDLAKICKAIGSVMGQRLTDQTLAAIASAIGETEAWSFVKPIIFSKNK